MTDNVLHGLTRLLLRLLSPRAAHAVVKRVGRFFPSLATRAAILKARDHLGGRGTCLSRALAIAARAKHAEVVIGVAPRAGERLFAHAWLELSGVPLDVSDVAGSEIARLRGRDLGQIKECASASRRKMFSEKRP